MAPTESIKKKTLDTLPADFNDWDSGAPPSTLPPDFGDFDPSPASPQPAVSRSKTENNGSALKHVEKTSHRSSAPPAAVPAAGSHDIQLPFSERIPFEDPATVGAFREHRTLILSLGSISVLLLGGTVAFMHARGATQPPDPTIAAEHSAPASIASRPSPSLSKPVPANPAAHVAATPQQTPPAAEARPQVDSQLMQSQLNAPARLSTEIKKPSQTEAPPNLVNGYGIDALGTGSAPGVGRMFSNKATPEVRPAVPERVKLSTSQAMNMAAQVKAPAYPLIARNARVSGTVALQAVISKEGTIASLRVVGGPKLLEQAALDAVKTWRFRPYTISNQRVEVETTLNVIFKMSE